MYKVIIADDEWIIREGLKHTVNWEQVQCEIIAEAADGIQSLQEILTHKPDILISDIRMPGMNGLELAEAAKRHCPELKVIFLTGFEDFTYAQQAVKLKADDFVLKPTDPDVLLEAVGRVCNEISSARYNANTVEHLLDWKQSGESIILEKLVHDGMLGFLDSRSRQMLHEMLGYCHESILGLRVAVGELASFVRSAETDANDLMRVSLGSCLQHILLGPPIFLGAGKVGLLLEATDDIVQDLQRTARQLDKEGEVRFGLSRPYERLDRLEAAYREAVEALGSKRPADSQAVLEYGDIKRWEGSNVPVDAEHFRQVEAYIEQNYADELSLQKLAALFHLSEAHFSRLFRKRTGVSFIDYLTQVRMEQAKKLLRSPDARINEVAIAVGYQDSRYFSQLFRKIVGSKPTEYRNRNMQ